MRELGLGRHAPSPALSERHGHPQRPIRTPSTSVPSLDQPQGLVPTTLSLAAHPGHGGDAARPEPPSGGKIPFGHRRLQKHTEHCEADAEGRMESLVGPSIDKRA